MPLLHQSDSEEPDDVNVASTVQYGTEAFSRCLETLMASTPHRTGTRLIFHGGVRDLRQQALATLTRYATGNMHQFSMPSLLSNQRMQTQNNLRKAFDHAAEENALLYFDQADILFTHTHADTPNDAAGNASPSTVEYFFDRVGAYDGVVVLGLQRKSHVEQARNAVHLVVQFE